MKPRERVTPSPSPTMIDDRMGTMGSTHGVSDRPRPAMKNNGRIIRKLRPFNALAKAPLSSALSAGVASVCAAVVDVAAGAVPIGAASTGFDTPEAEAGAEAAAAGAAASVATGCVGAATSAVCGVPPPPLCDGGDCTSEVAFDVPPAGGVSVTRASCGG